ncbi:MAG TPA: hypothetical protein VFT02_09270, partial [Pyrinomonadaceae bacterium]|nr:hypothetical protein [Pyrinomonadaceae bacterium]
ENRVQWLQRFYSVGKEAVRPRRPGELFGFLVEPSPNTSALLQILERGDVEVVRPKPGTPLKVGTRTLPEGTQIVRMDQPYGAFAKALLEVQRYPNLRDAAGHPVPPYDVTAHTLPLLMGVQVHAVKAPFRYTLPTGPITEVVGASNACDWAPGTPLRGLYRSSVPAYDEGWTRWILDQKEYPYRTITDKDLRERVLVYKPSPGITIRYPAIVIPDQSARTLLEGYRAGAMPPEYTGGIGAEGVRTLREYVESGGTLVFLNRASSFAIEQFKLPVLNVVAGLPRTEFYVPGSILRIELDGSHPIAAGTPEQTIAWVEDSPIFEVADVPGASVPATNARVIARYPAEQDALLSGWLLGGEKLKGKAALVEVKMGEGKIILFGFRPQYRAQSLATYQLFFNAIGRQ